MDIWVDAGVLWDPVDGNGRIRRRFDGVTGEELRGRFCDCCRTVVDGGPIGVADSWGCMIGRPEDEGKWV